LLSVFAKLVFRVEGKGLNAESAEESAECAGADESVFEVGRTYLRSNGDGDG